MDGAEKLFFASRRRHTISKRDWSSDVCSSDLTNYSATHAARLQAPPRPAPASSNTRTAARCSSTKSGRCRRGCRRSRSEERRVGKECSIRWLLDLYKQKIYIIFCTVIEYDRNQ